MGHTASKRFPRESVEIVEVGDARCGHAIGRRSQLELGDDSSRDMGPSVFTGPNSTSFTASQERAVESFEGADRALSCSSGAAAMAAFRLVPIPGVQSPLGWTLSSSSRDQMLDQVALHDVALTTVADWFEP